MPSRDSSTRRGNVAPDPLVPDLPHQRGARPDQAVRSIEEFVEFLTQVEAVTGSDDRPRGPTVGHRFLL